MNFEIIKGYKLGDEIIDVRNLHRYGIVPVDKLIYDKITSFNNGYSKVGIGEFKGLIDKTGKEVVPVIFADVSFPIDNTVLVRDPLTKRWSIVSLDLKKFTKFKYSDILPLSCGLMAASDEDFACGYVDKNGEVVIPFEYDYVYSFHNDLAAVAKGSLFGLINKNNEVIIPFEYALLKKYSYGLIPAKNKNTGKWGFIDINNKLVIPHIYEKACSFYNGLAVVRENGQSYNIDVNGKKIEKLIFDFNEDDEVINDKPLPNKINQINDNMYSIVGKEIVKSKEEVIKFKEKGLYGLKNIYGEVILKPEYKRITDFSEGYACINQNGKWGLVDTKGNIIGNGHRKIDLENKKIITFTYMYHDGKDIKLLPNNNYVGLKDNNTNKCYWFETEEELNEFIKERNYDINSSVKLVKTKGYN